MQTLRRVIASALILTVLFVTPSRVEAYGILTHEMLIDATWESSIVPVLRHYYPNATEKDILNARAYVYGGALIQDSGYYKSGRPYMADVTHYVRSGDFVVNLFRNVTCLEELAFAIGALSHYIGDSYGHRYATNPMVYRRFPGLDIDRVPLVPLQSVTYEQGKKEHTRVEFGFDVNALAHQRIAPGSFHQAVGIDVAYRQFALAFYQTYGLAEDFVDPRNDFKGSAYHWTAFHALPYVARSQVKQSKWNASDEGKGAAQQALVEIESCISRHEEWNSYPGQPTVADIAAGHLLNTVPKLKLVPVDAVSEEAYAHSVLLSLSALMHILNDALQVPDATAAADHTFVPHYSVDGTADATHPLANINLDTGFKEPALAYHLTDAAYFAVLQRLAQHPDYPIPAEIRSDLLTYFDAASGVKLRFETTEAIHRDRLKDVAWLHGVTSKEASVPYPEYASGKVIETPVEPLVKMPAADAGGCNPSNLTLLKQLRDSSNVP